MSVVLESGSLNIPEPSEPVQDCNGVAFIIHNLEKKFLSISHVLLMSCKCLGLVSNLGEVKVKVHPITGHEGPEGV